MISSAPPYRTQLGPLLVRRRLARGGANGGPPPSCALRRALPR
ncbi:hypothetical protein ACN263_21105 [Micromonospora sp. WMMD729]